MVDYRVVLAADVHDVSPGQHAGDGPGAGLVVGCLRHQQRVVGWRRIGASGEPLRSTPRVALGTTGRQSPYLCHETKPTSVVVNLVDESGIQSSQYGWKPSTAGPPMRALRPSEVRRQQTVDPAGHSS